MLAGRVKEVEHANLTFTSLDAFLSSFNRSYAEGLMRNPLSAVFLSFNFHLGLLYLFWSYDVEKGYGLRTSGARAILY